MKLTGITDDQVKDAPVFKDIAREVSRLKDAIIVGYNLEFDKGFVSAELERVGLDWPDNQPELDPLIFALVSCTRDGEETSWAKWLNVSAFLWRMLTEPWTMQKRPDTCSSHLQRATSRTRGLTGCSGAMADASGPRASDAQKNARSKRSWGGSGICKRTGNRGRSSGLGTCLFVRG